MSSETQRPSRPSGAVGHSALGKGAADSAPTAPHATPHEGAPMPHGAARSGPARFWDRRRVRRAFAVAFVFSAGVHSLFAPSLLPKQRLEMVEVEGELTISIDSIEEASPEPPPPPPPIAETPPPPTPEAEGIGSTKRDAGPKPPKDAGRDVEKDAAGDAEVDADVERERDGGIPLVDLVDAAAGSALDGGIALATDGSAPPGANGPRDPTAMIGGAGKVQADVPNVQLLLNFVEIRKNPVGAKMGPLLSAIPEWDEFIAGTKVDPMRDTEWISMQGPSLYSKRTSRLAIIIRYSAPDAVVDKAVEIVSKKYASGGVFDAGVPGVRAYLGHADFAPRVFLRPQSHVLAVVPPDYANTAAKILSKTKVDAKVRPGEAMRMTLRNPTRPMPFLPSSLTELRIWVTGREDGGADVFAEADAGTPADAEQAAKDIKKLVKDQNSIGVQLLSKGLLNRTEVVADGPTVRLKVAASEEQIQAVMDFVSAYFGIGKPPP